MIKPIEQFLRRYAVRKRIVDSLIAFSLGSSIAIASILMLAMLDRWLVLGSRIRVCGWVVVSIVAVGIVAWNLWFVFQRFDPVTAAMEIERHRPDFDQRLITVASAQMNSPLIDQLQKEVEGIFADVRIGSLLKLRSLWIAIVVLVMLLGLLVGFSHRLQLRRIYSPLPASSKMNSTSTAASRGNVLAPMAARA